MTLRQADDSSLIELEGVIDIACAQELKAALVEAIDKGRKVSVVAEANTEMDVTAMQLLWAAQQAANEKGVALTFPESLSAAIEELSTRAGLKCIPVQA
ncbi:MAG TPA: STAS domain-containing protein [Terracidiphilus sp.]|nr:STAS domain-containing protein [Terracidiphilus sp.]